MHERAISLSDSERRSVHLRACEEQHVDLTRAEAEWLQRTHARHLSLARKSESEQTWLVRAGHVCGLIALPGGRRLYVEPRVAVRNVWTMLGAAERLDCLTWPPSTGETPRGLVDGLMDVFVREVEILIARGVAVDYQRCEQVLSRVRGQIDVHRQMRELPGALDRFACRFAQFSRETPENRVLTAALQVIARAAGPHSDLRAAATRCLREIGCSVASELQQHELAAARIGAATRHYRVPMALARLLLQTLGAGHRPVAGFQATKTPSLLVEMPRLFERFVCHALQRSLSGRARVRSRGHSVALDDESHAMLTPDAVVEGPRGPLCVVDAKYKPEPIDRHEPSASDVYQMLAYCVGYGVRHAVLVYPRRVDAAPVRITRDGLSATIHPLGLDLSAEAHSLRPLGELLAGQIAELVDLPGAATGCCSLSVRPDRVADSGGGLHCVRAKACCADQHRR